MALDSTLGTTNIHWRNNYASGLYNSCYTTKVGGFASVNFSGCKFMKRTVTPKVYATTTGTTNFSINSYVRSKAIKFYFNIMDADLLDASDGVRFDSPLLTNYALSWTAQYWTGLSADSTYISCTADNADYGYNWDSWRQNSSSGTVLSYSQNFLFYYNNASQSGTTTAYANYNLGKIG